MSAAVVRVAGTKLTAAAGLLIIAAGLGRISGASVTSTYAQTVAGMVMLGIGAGLAIPAATGSVMGSLPRGDTGVGSARPPAGAEPVAAASAGTTEPTPAAAAEPAPADERRGPVHDSPRRLPSGPPG
jgi:hypothetical protein